MWPLKVKVLKKDRDKKKLKNGIALLKASLNKKDLDGVQETNTEHNISLIKKQINSGHQKPCSWFIICFISILLNCQQKGGFNCFNVLA